MNNEILIEEVEEEGVAVGSVEHSEEQSFDSYDSLPPFEKLKFVAPKLGIKIVGEPRADCPHCKGDGVVGYTPVDGSKLGLPIACVCVPISREYGFMPKLNRVARRKLERSNRIAINKRKAKHN